MHVRINRMGDLPSAGRGEICLNLRFDCLIGRSCFETVFICLERDLTGLWFLETCKTTGEV